MEEVKKLYNALIGKGYTSTDLGDEKVFAEKMQDATNRKELYDYVSSRGDFKIGSYDNYEKRLGSTVQPVQPEVSAIEDAPKVEEKPQENLESDLLKPQSTETPSLLNMGAKPKDYFAEAGTKAREAIRQERQPREYQEIMKPYTSSFGSKKEHEFINTIEGYNQATRIFGGEEANRRRDELNEQARPWMEAQKTWTPSSARRFREQTMEQTWYDPYAVVPEEYKALATKQWGKEGSEDAYFSAWMNLTPEQREAFIRKEHVKSFFNEETTSKMQGIRERATTYANNALSEIPVSVDPRYSATAMAARTVNNIGVQTTKALDKAEEIKQAYKNHQLDENFFTGAYKGMKDGLTDIDNWTGIYMIGEMTNLYDIADKMEKGVQLSQAEEDFLDAQAYKLAVEAALADDLGWGYKSGNVTGASVPFMLQMLASPIGGASGKAIDKGFAAVGKRAIDKFGKGILKKLLTKAPVKKVAKGLVGTVGKGIGQTILFGSDRVAAGTMQRHLGNEMVAERANEEFNAGVQAKSGEDWGTALFKEGVSASMENISEFAGSAFIDDFTKAVGKTIAKEFLDAIDGPVGRRLANAASKQKANKIFQAIANNKWGQHAVNISKSVQNGMAWDGLINEYLEEVLNNAANVMIGDMSVEDFTSLEKNAETILGLAWTSGFFTANSAVSRVGGYIRGNIALRRTDRAAQQIFTGDMQEKWNAYTQALSQANGYEEVEQLYKGLIADISNNQDKETARAQITEATAYMTNYVKMMGMNAATEEAEEEEPKTPAQQEVESAQGEGIAAHGTEKELDVVEEMEQSYNQLAEHLGGTNVEDWLLQYGETADKQLEAIRGSELDEQTKAMADTYLTSAQRYEGLLLANQEEVDAIVEEAAKEFDANVNQELGSVIQVLTTQDKVAYVIQGNPNEREQITLRYNDGSMEQASSKVVEKVLSESDAQAIRGDMLEGVRKSAIAEIVTRMQGNVPNATQMQMPVGHSVVVDGQAGVVAGVNADGTMQIQMQGGNAVNAAPQQVMDAQAYNDIMERKARAREGVTVSVPVREEAEVPVSEEAATEVVEAIEEMSEAQKLLQEYMDESVSLEDRQAIVENNVAQAKQAAMEAQAEFDAMNESKPNAKDYTNIAEFKQAQEQWKAQMQEKQQLLDIARQQEATWNEVQSGINQPVVAEDISEHTEATPATPQAIEDLQAEAKNHNSKHDIKALAKEIGVSAKRIQRVIDFANQIGVKLNFANVTRTEGDKGAFTNADNMSSKREITMSKYMLAKGMAIEWVMGHELTHQIKADGNAAQWETYKQTIINALGQETFDKRVKSQSKVYSMAGAYKNMPANEFMETMEEEVCADAAGDMLLNPDNMNKVMGVPQSLASRIWNGLKNMITFSTPSKIKQAVDAWQQLAEGKEMIEHTEGKKHSIVGVTGARALDKAEGTTVRMDNMDVAEEMEAAGKDAETIWMATGWERGVDGKWKYDIMDYIPEFVDQTAKKQVYEDLIDAKTKEYEAATNPTEKHELRMRIGEYMDKSAELSQYFVADILGEDHPLIKAYPDLGNITIEFNPNTEDCCYYPVIEQIELGTKNEDAATNARNLAHELQHAIQHAEGFARGGNISSANVKIEEVKNILGINDKASINDIITYLEHGLETPSQNKALTDLAKKEGYDNAIDYVSSLNPIGYYNRLAGEVESRNASARQDMTPEERRSTPLSKSEDIAREEQIVLEDESIVKHSISPLDMSEDEKLQRGEMLRNAPAIDVQSNTIVATPELSARRVAEQWWEENVPEAMIYDTEVGEVEINKNSIESSLAHRYGQKKLDAITSLVEGFENAVYLGTLPDGNRQEGVLNHYFAYPINYEGQRNYVFCRAMQDANKNRLYVHEVFVEDKITKGNTLQTAASQPHGGISLYRDILANVLSASKDTQSVSTMQTDKKEISEKSAESKVEVTNEEVANDKKFSINDNNVASHIYNMDATRAWMWVLRNSPKGVRAKGYGYIDKDRLGEFQDWYDIYLNSGAEEYIQALEELKNKATKKAQEYIDEVIAGVEKHRDDFRRLAEGDDSVLSTSNAAKFSITAEHKQKQLDIISESNPVGDDYHTWIRTVDDIKSFEEALDEPGYADFKGEDLDPSYTWEMVEDALQSGRITVYSSKPIKNGNFVTPSRMEAESYAGNGKVYKATLPLQDIAWIDPTQGQVAKVDETKFSISAESQKIFDTAKAEYGTTEDFGLAGYMLPDGDLLDFSNGSGARTLDHRNIRRVYPDVEHDSRWEYVVDFMNDGAIRLVPESGIIQMTQQPTLEQRKKLKEYIRQENGYVIVEINNANGNSQAYKEYDEGTTPNNVLADIDRYFDEGIRFSLSAEEQSIIDTAKANGTYMLAPNGEPSNLNEKQWAQVRTKAFKEWFGDWEKILRIEKLRGSNPIVVEFNGEYELNRDSAKQWMKDNLRGEYINADTGEKILLSKVGINEVTAHGSKDEAHLKSLSAIPSMIEGAVFIDELVNSKGHDKYDSYRYYVCGLVIDGVDYTAKIVVGVKDGSRYYDHRLTEIEKGTLLDNLNGLSNSVVDMQNTSSSVGKDTKLISILQTNSSKIVDENGEPMVVYHYTPNEFTEFDTEKIGSSTDVGAFGTGFYLSPSDGFSLYGKNKMALFVNAKNPMRLNDSNAFDAKEPFFKKDYEWTKESAQAFADDVQAKGYDAVYYENRGMDEIVAFNPNQIKSATENNGEFSEDNDDVRYSIPVYHGSGAKFDKFDHAFMGSGEGAQAFGWGTYVTEVEGIAKAYADSSSGNIFHSGFGDFYLRKIREGLANGETFEKVKQNLLEHHKQIYEKTGGNRELYGTFISDYEKLQSLKEEDLPVRNLYTVEIPDDNGSNYLEWDKAINENIQQRIANGLKNIGFEVEPETNHLTLSRGKNRAVLNVKAKGMDLYAELEDVLGSAKAASQFLSDLGYTGIKYPAQATTGGRADNAQNYVIFNESDAQIVDHRRFSIPTRLQQLNKAEEFIKSSILGKRRNKSFEITLPIAVLKEIKKALGRDFDSHNIDGNSFVHAKKEHGINGQKNNMSSIPLRDEDFALAPYIMVAPDLVQKGNMDAAGRESIRFIKNIDNGEVIVVEKEQKNSPDDMDTITMWADLSSNVLDARQRRPLSTTSETVVISSDYVAKIRKDAEEAIRADVEYLQKQANAKSGEQKYSIYGGNKGYVGYSMSKRAVNADIRYSMPADILAANERFNEELDEYIKKGTKANFIFHIGQPLGVMKIFFPELPIVMRPRVINKASNTKHDVDATSLYNLPQYIAEPIFVFQREDGAIGILTEMMDNNGKNVCVAVELNKKIQDGGTYLDVNDIRSIHGRDVKNIVLPIIHNNTLKYADKEKALDWFSSASSIYQQEITSQELSDATKIVQDFQNPPLPDDESSQNVENAKSGEQKYSLPARPAMPRRNEGESIMDYAQRVANATEAQRAWDVANKTAMDIDRQMKDSEEYRDILAQKEPQTIEEAASITLASGKLLWNDHIDGTKVSKGAKSMMGWGEGERRSFFAMFASKENGGVSVEQMGESVIEICHQYNIPVDDTDAMVGVNALLEVLQSAEKPSDITGYIEHNRIEQVRRMIEEEQELLANERNKAYMDIYGMTYDDFVEITSTIDTEDEQERIDDKNVIAWLYGQSQRQQERITNAQAELEQMRNSGVAKAQYDAAYRALEQMKAKAKQIQAKLDEVTRELSAAKGQATRQKKANMHYKEQKGQWKQVYKELRKAINGKNIRSIDKNTLNEIMRAVGRADLSGKAKPFGEAGMIEDIVLGVNMRAAQDRIDKLLATKTTALNDKGIATGKSVDASVQAILANVRKTLEGILHHDIENQIHDLRSQNWHIRHNALGNLSQEQQEQIDANKAKIEELKAELSRELATNTANTEQAVNEQIDKLTEQIDMGLRTEEESAELMTTLALKRQMVAIHTSYQDTAPVESLLRRKKSELRKIWDALHDANTPQDKRKEYRQKGKALQEQIAGLKAQVREGRRATLDAMQAFADSLEETITTGRTNLKGKMQEQLQRRKEFIAKAIHDVNASGKQMQSVNEAEKQENDKLPWYKRMFSPALRTFDYMLQKIATRTYGKDSWLYRQFMLGENGVMAAHDEYLRGMQTAARTLEDKAMEIFGKSYQDVMAESNKKKDIGIEILRDAEDYEPSYIPLKLTKGQATYIYMLWRMRDGYSKLATQGFTEEIMLRIEEYIGPDYIQWADWVQMEYLPMMREKYNARYREIYDTNMAAIDNYVPIRIHGQAIRKEVDLTDATASMPGMQKKNGALIQRTVNVNPIDISNNIFELIGQHIDEMEEFYAYAPVRRDLQYILSSPAFRNLLNTQEPGTFQSLLEAARIATKTNQQPESAASKAFNDILNKWQKGLVSGNIAYRNMTAIKQVLSAPAFIGYSQSPVYLSILAGNMLGGYLRNLPAMAFPLIPGIGHWAQKMTVEETAKGMPYLDKYLGETFRWCMREFPDFRERVTRGSAGDIRLEEKGFSKLLDKYTELGMSANVFIDAVTVSVGLKSIYDYEMAKAAKRISKMAEEMQMDKQWTEEEMRKASNAAKIQATLFANQTQQSSNPALLSPMQVSKNFMERSLTLYKNSSLGLMRAGIGGMRDVSRYMKDQLWYMKDQLLHKKGKKARRRMIEEYTRMFMQEGFAENEAKKRAISYLNSEARKGAFVALLEGYVMNVIWNLGSKGLLGFMAGGDDDDKERTIGEWVWDGIKHVVKNTFGSAMPFVNDALEGRLPVIGLTTSEAEKAWKDIKKQLDENGISLALVLTGMRYAAKFGGVDMQVWANTMDGYYRLFSETGNSDDNTLALMLILNSPHSNRMAVARELYKGKSEEEFQRAIELAGRYNQPVWTFGREMTDKVESDMAAWYLSDNATEEEKQRMRYVEEMKERIDNLETVEDALELFDEVSDTELRKKISNKIDQLRKPEDTFADKVDRKKENALAEDDADMSGYTYMKMADSQDLLDEKRLRAEIGMLSAVVERQKELFTKHGSESEIYTTYMAEHGVEIRRYHALQAYHRAIQTRKRKMDQEGADVNALYEKIKELYDDARNI